MPDSIKLIGEEAFDDCDNLEEIVLPKSIKTINYRAFRACYNLKKIQFPASLKDIDDCAFSGCTSLEKIIIPSSVEHIGQYVFNYCKSLKEIKINAKCKLPEGLFCKCDNLKHIYMTQESYDLSPDFVNRHEDKIEIIKPKTLDDLLDEGKSFREINKILTKNNFELNK